MDFPQSACSDAKAAIQCIGLGVTSRVDANKARHVAFPLNSELGVRTLPNDTFGAFPGGGVPQRMKANPKNSSTSDMIQQLHLSPWCRHPTTRAAQVALSTIVIRLSPEQNQALDIFERTNSLLASCAPLIVTARGLLRGPADGHDIECFMLRRMSSGSVQCVYVCEGKARVSPLSQQASLVGTLNDNGAAIARGELVCLFNNSCLPRGACSLLFSVLGTIPSWCIQQQQMLVKRREFYIQQYATPIRVVTNDLVAASNVNIFKGIQKGGALSTEYVYSPKQELPPGAVLANILSRRPGLQPPGCVSVPPTTATACLQAFTASIVEAARLTLGLRTVDGRITPSQIRARLQQVQMQLCGESDGANSGQDAHTAAAAGLIDMEALTSPVSSAHSQASQSCLATGHQATVVTANMPPMTMPPRSSHTVPTFESLPSTKPLAYQPSGAAAMPISGAAAMPPGGGPAVSRLAAPSREFGRVNISIRIRRNQGVWRAIHPHDGEEAKESPGAPAPEPLIIRGIMGGAKRPRAQSNTSEPAFIAQNTPLPTLSRPPATQSIAIAADKQWLSDSRSGTFGTASSSTRTPTLAALKLGECFAPVYHQSEARPPCAMSARDFVPKPIVLVERDPE